MEPERYARMRTEIFCPARARVNKDICPQLWKSPDARGPARQGLGRLDNFFSRSSSGQQLSYAQRVSTNDSRAPEKFQFK